MYLLPMNTPCPSWSNIFSKFRIFGNLNCYWMVSGWYLIRTEFHWVAIWKVSLGTVFRFWNFVWTPKIQKREDFHFKGNTVCLFRFLLPMLKAHLYRGVHPSAVQPVKGVKGCGEGEKIYWKCSKYIENMLKIFWKYNEGCIQPSAVQCSATGKRD